MAKNPGAAPGRPTGRSNRFGAVGRRVAHLCLSFGAAGRRLWFLRNPGTTGSKVNVPGGAPGDGRYRESAFNLRPEHHHLINRDVLTRIKPGAVIVNTARGGLVDETALLDVLTSGQVDAAALDVFEQEPDRGPLLGCENVVLTSHVGSLPRELDSEWKLKPRRICFWALIKPAFCRKSG